MRGREQQHIDFYGGLVSDGGRATNYIRYGRNRWNQRNEDLRSAVEWGMTQGIHVQTTGYSLLARARFLSTDLRQSPTRRFLSISRVTRATTES